MEEDAMKLEYLSAYRQAIILRTAGRNFNSTQVYLNGTGTY